MSMAEQNPVGPVAVKAQPKDRKSAIRVALPQILAVTVKNILLVAYGTTLGYPTILIPNLSSHTSEDSFHLNQEQISWIGSINMMMIPIGCFLSGIITQPIGRKRSMQIITIPLFFSWLIFYFSSQIWHIYLALSITGLCGGLFEAPILTYVAEVTQPHLRGMLSATSTFAIIIGILIQFLLGSFLKWRSVALVCSAFPILSFTLLLFIPESPYWLIMNNKLTEGRKSLAWLRGWTTMEEIEVEFQAKINEFKETKSVADKTINSDKIYTIDNNQSQKSLHKTQILVNYFKKSYLWPLFIISFFFFVPHFSGSTTLQIYAVQIFATLQAPIDKYHATIILGVAEFFGCVISVVLVHYTGKRVMGLISLIGNGVCAIVVATYAYNNDINYFALNNQSSNVTMLETYDTAIEEHKWIPMIFLILLAFLSHCGIRSLSWILIAEVFSKETRAVGCGMASGIGYIFGFTANKIFLKTVALITLPGLYWFYGCLSFLSAIILHFILPETEGKTLQEITDHFAGISKLTNKVQRHNEDETKEENSEDVIDTKL